MKIGLLWYDNDPKRNLTDKITRAARRYHEKYGTQPNCCYVHKSCLAGNSDTAQVGAIHVASQPTSLLHHFWIGQEEP